MKNEKLSAIVKKAAIDFQSYSSEHEEKILEAWDAAEQEAQDNGQKPKFKLGFTVTLNLDEDSMETALTWGIRHKASSTSAIPDPNQPMLPMVSEKERGKN